MNKTKTDRADAPTIQTLRETSAAEKVPQTILSLYLLPEHRIQVERTSR